MLAFFPSVTFHNFMSSLVNTPWFVRRQYYDPSELQNILDIRRSPPGAVILKCRMSNTEVDLPDCKDSVICIKEVDGGKYDITTENVKDGTFAPTVAHWKDGKWLKAQEGLTDRSEVRLERAKEEESPVKILFNVQDDNIEPRGLHELARCRAVVFEFTEDEWTDVPRPLLDDKWTYIELCGDVAYYRSPLLVTRELKRAFCKAVALMMYIGLPVVFCPVGSEFGVRIAKSKKEMDYPKWIARRVSAVFRMFPDLVELVRPQQLDLLLLIDELRSTKFFEITQSYSHEMVRLCYKQKLAVRALSGLDSTTIGDYRFARSYQNLCATVVIPQCNPAPVPEYEPVFDSLRMHIQKGTIAKNGIFKQTRDRIVSFVDIGVAKYPYALASQVSSSLFLPGRPGSVQFHSGAEETFVMFTSRDKNDLMANALAVAVALAISDSVVIPSGLPIDQLVETLKAAQHYAPLLLNTRDAVVLSPGKIANLRAIILACEQDSSEAEARAATAVLHSTVHSLCRSWEGVVDCALTPCEAGLKIQGYHGSFGDRSLLVSYGVATFSAVNDNWEYCQLAYKA